jgi:hypothetical protein
MGVYKTDVGSFIKAYVRQKEQMKENYGIDYDAPDENILLYTTCQQVYINNQLVSLLCFQNSFIGSYFLHR